MIIKIERDNTEDYAHLLVYLNDVPQRVFMISDQDLANELTLVIETGCGAKGHLFEWEIKGSGDE